MTQRQAELLSKLDPDNFSVDEVRDILRVTEWGAKQIVATAVRRGEFVRNGNRYALAPELKS